MLQFLGEWGGAMTDQTGHSGGNRVLVLDDMPFKRTVITEFLKSWAEDAGLELIPSSVEEALSQSRLTGFRMVILSIGGASLADPNVVAAYRILSMIEPSGRIVILGDCPDADNIERAIDLGIAGYIATSIDADVAVAALNFILAGGGYFPPEALRNVATQPQGTPPKGPSQLPAPTLVEADRPKALTDEKSRDSKELPRNQINRKCPQQLNPACNNDLTARQQEVLECLTRARSNKEIARELEMSEATVKVHVRQVMKKLGALNRTHAAILATQGASTEETVEPKIAPFALYKSNLHHALAR